MNFDVVCSHCTSELEVDEHVLGTDINCPICQGVLNVEPCEISSSWAYEITHKYPKTTVTEIFFCVNLAHYFVALGLNLSGFWGEPVKFDFYIHVFVIITCLVAMRGLATKQGYACTALKVLFIAEFLWALLLLFVGVKLQAAIWVVGSIIPFIKCIFLYEGFKAVKRWKSQVEKGTFYRSYCPSCQTPFTLKSDRLDKELSCNFCDSLFVSRAAC